VSFAVQSELLRDGPIATIKSGLKPLCMISPAVRPTSEWTSLYVTRYSSICRWFAADWQPELNHATRQHSALEGGSAHQKAENSSAVAVRPGERGKTRLPV
jgi:hypothetical protein